MRWQGGRRSENIEDRRGGALPRGVRLGGMGGLGVLIIAVVAMFLGIDPRELFQGGPMDDSPDVSVPPSQGTRETPVGNDELRNFVSVVLADTEDTWQEVFQVRYVSDGSAMIISVGPGKKASPHRASAS